MLLIVLLAGALLVLFLALPARETPIESNDATHLSDRVVSESEPRAVDEEIGIVADPAVTTATTSPERPVERPRVVKSILFSVEDSIRMIDEVIVAALDGDSEAQIRLHSVLESCEAFFEKLPRDVDEFDAEVARYANLPGSVYYDTVATHASCTRIDDDPRLESQDAGSLLQDALQGGHPLAWFLEGERLRQGNDYEAAEGYLHRALFSGHPEAAVWAGSTLTLPPNDLDTDAGRVTQAVHAYAWVALACQFGMDCSQNGSLGQELCHGGCAPHEDVLDAVARVMELNPRDRELASRLAATYRDAIERQDPTFFSLIPPEEDTQKEARE